jgi:hypothetical protein
VFENRMLRKTFGTKTDEVRSWWRKIHNEDLHKFSFRNIIRITKARRTRWVGHVALMGRIGTYTGYYLFILLKRQKKSVNTIKINLGDIGYGGMDLIDLAQNKDQWSAVVDTVMKLWIP